MRGQYAAGPQICRGPVHALVTGIHLQGFGKPFEGAQRHVFFARQEREEEAPGHSGEVGKDGQSCLFLLSQVSNILRYTPLKLPIRHPGEVRPVSSIG